MVKKKFIHALDFISKRMFLGVGIVDQQFLSTTIWSYNKKGGNKISTTKIL